MRVRMARKSVALSLVNSRVTTVPPLALTAFSDLVGEALAVGGAVVDDGDLLAQGGGRVLADAQRPCCTSLAMVRKVDLEVLLGEPGDWWRPARPAGRRLRCRCARRDGGAGLRWPTTPFTPASTRRWATVVAVFGSAASSSAMTSELHLLAAQGHALGVVFPRWRGARRSRCPCPGATGCR